MALSSNCIWEVRTSGSDTNGGFFNPAASGVDYSQQNTSQLSLSDVSTNGTTTITSAAGGFTAAMVGNGINIGGTIYEIVGRTDTNTITTDRAASAGSLQSAKVGGALASAGKAAGAMVAGNWLWIKAGNYNITTTTANISGGPMSFVGALAGGRLMKVEGYSTVRGDAIWGSVPPVQFAPTIAGAGGSLVTVAAETVLRNVGVNGNNTLVGGLGGWQGISATNSRIESCQSINCTDAGISLTLSIGRNLSVSNTKNNYHINANSSTVEDCIVSGGNANGFLVSDQTSLIRPLAYNIPAGSGARSNTSSTMNNIIDGARFYNCSLGISSSASNKTSWGIYDSIFMNCGTGVSCSTTWSNMYIRGCAFWNNTTDISTGINAEIANKINLTSNPFADVTNADFRLTPAAATYLKSQGFPVRGDWEQLPLAFSPIGSSLISSAARLSC